ncbi:23S rRNA m(6)A-1618 methyltransferase [Rheinheimera pacifica]|uniref:Ribosomal RNA large subunit methyltransferase F n=1 Tax=Rheinheimera pacifica TaxID=173990 RepID=A0A1H6N7R3_9GAMM|nr:23S rRNA (adenine(1618)-N(6))-methyltransferase RlmF [Rheinheimera pacifica]SEI10801.1 23S rRNA m(6)A-1618 methyltransferase [Rheinheimera pacifica]
MSSQQLLHPRNLHQGRYDFAALIAALPQLEAYVRLNPSAEPTIDFTDNQAVVLLNQALLAKYYQVKYWQLPPGYLCPPIPGRADYVHYLADLLARSYSGLPTGKQIKLLDIGTGANVIYPVIASQSYGWQVCGTDIDAVAVKAAALIVAANPVLKSHINIVQQHDVKAIFSGVIKGDQRFHLTMCNPPFFASSAEAEAASSRKWANLGKAGQGHQRNFAGQQHELWCEGGELKFISQMITESQLFKQQVSWFSTLVSQQKHVSVLKKLLRSVGAVQSEVIEMRQGQKVSRILAWSFLTPQQQTQW